MDLGIQPLLVRDVHRAVLRPDDVEGPIREWHRQRVPVVEGDPVAEPAPLREQRADAAVLLGEVEHGDLTSDLVRQCSRRTTQPAAYVEYLLAALQSGEADQLPRPVLATGMELIHRREIVRRESVGIFPGCPQAVQDKLAQLLMPVVSVDAARICDHRSTSILPDHGCCARRSILLLGKHSRPWTRGPMRWLRPRWVTTCF